jgi:PhzF family phenazine biosynthesis protein
MTDAIPLFHVDAFTPAPFAGNPAAVCLLECEARVDWMQALGAEMNLSETAFVRRLATGFELRWFTPAVEVDLCGHATLAAAHVLWEQGWLPLDQAAHFHTRSGLLIARRADDVIELDFPATPATACAAPAGLLPALGLDRGDVLFNGVDYLVEMDDEASLRQLRPDFAALRRIEMRGVMVTARSRRPTHDFVSRFFAPAAGIDEDPVTGSAHCTLGPFWARRLGKTELHAFQASARGGELRVRLQGERVVLAGTAVTVFEGRLLV